MAMAKKKIAPEKDASERWLLTYSDLMNLLLILFIILYCASKVDAKNAATVSQSMREGFGYVEDGAASGTGTGTGSGTGTGTGTGTGSGASGDTTVRTYDDYNAELLKMIKENNLENKVTVEMSSAKVVISFMDNVLFDQGSADLSTMAAELIDKIGGMLTNLDYSFILVEGHTDSDPIHNYLYADNMDLSTMRAANVWRELQNCGLSPTNMASIGYGEYRPIAPNDTAENKAKNRRVVITIIRSSVSVDKYISSETIRGATESSAAPKDSPAASETSDKADNQD